MAQEAGAGQVGDAIALGGALRREGAAVASWGTFESEVFAVHTDGVLRNRYWDGSSWHEWEEMGGGFAGPVAASARSADRIDVLAVDDAGRLRHRWWDGTRWVEWRPLDARSCTCAPR